jgi:hypothetical protein
LKDECDFEFILLDGATTFDSSVDELEKTFNHHLYKNHWSVNWRGKSIMGKDEQ